MTVSIDRDAEIALVTVDNPPVNALGQALRQRLWDTVDILDADPSVRAVVLICAGRTFIAGADVTEFGKPPVPPHLPDLVARLEQAAKPWTAAIHGSALGGGFEIAMGCRFRIALDSASVGLPEVVLGIVPGASGTVRTPRLAGVAAAVDLVTTGRPVKAAKALTLGLVDAVVAGDLVAEAVAFTRAALARPLPQPVSARPVTPPDPEWWDSQRQAIAARVGGEVAPLRALDCLRAAAERPFAEALAFERATFLDLRGSQQAAALRHIFFAERAANRPAHLADATPHPLRSATVIGTGTLAAGIATALQAAGLSVTRVDPASPDLDALADSDLVLEALDSDLATRRAVFARLGQSCRADAVLATTTAEDPARVMRDLPNPDRCVGLLFPPTGKLLEILPLPSTSATTLGCGFALARSLGRIPVQIATGDSFVSSRLLARYRAEVDELIRLGIPATAVDAALRDHGFTSLPKAQVPAPSSHATPAHAAPPERPGLAPDGIFARLHGALTAEGKAMLAEGVTRDAADIDLVAVHGLGYPRWLGGPMFAAL